MSMMEYFEMGYQVVCGSMFGDVVMEDAEMVECYADDSVLVSVDDDAHVAHFYDSQDYED